MSFEYFCISFREERDVLKRQISGKTEEVHKQKYVQHLNMSTYSLTITKNRVTTAQGKQGIRMLTFPDRENKEFRCNIGKIVATQRKFLVYCLCVLCVHDVWGIYSGEYVSQLYVRGRLHVHLTLIA